MRSRLIVPSGTAVSTASLQCLLIRLGLRKLEIPWLGCGLDRLELRTVRSMIETLFKGMGVKILMRFYGTRDFREKSEDPVGPEEEGTSGDTSTSCSGTKQP